MVSCISIWKRWSYLRCLDLSCFVSCSNNNSVTGGVVVSSVQTGSLAEKAGLRGITQNDFSNTQTVGDIITRIDGHPLRSIDDLISYIDLHKSIGDNVGLTVNRHGQIMNLNLALEARPPSVQNATSLQSILP